MDRAVCELRYDEGIRFFEDDICGTLRTIESCGCKHIIEAEKIINLGGRKRLISGFRSIRRITPKECWRLMGCTDEDYEKAARMNSERQLYKQAGNSIVTGVLEHIIGRML